MEFPNFSDTLLVRMFHGSIPKPRLFLGNSVETPTYTNDPRGLVRPNVGGLLGGHVVVQLRDRVFGFVYIDAKKIHWVDQPEFNGEFHNYSVEEWEYIVKHRRETCFHIPATEEELMHCESYFLRECRQPSRDYSFWGERCASNVYRLLVSLNKIPSGNYRMQAFWPGALRRTLLSEAAKNQWLVSVKEGNTGEWWQGNISTFPPHPWHR